MRKLKPVRIDPKRKTVGSYTPMNSLPNYRPQPVSNPNPHIIIPEVKPIIDHTAYTYSGNQYKIALILHLYYEDLAIDYHNQLIELKKKINFDLYISISTGSLMDVAKISNMYVKSFNAIVFRFDNVGKDIVPKFRIIEHIHKKGLSYDYVYLFHDKKSPQYQRNGKGAWMDDWRDDLIRPLFDDNLRNGSLAIFENDNSVGAIGSHKHLHFGPGWYETMSIHRYKNESILLQHQEIFYSQLKKNPKVFRSWFIGGTMFWVRWDILKSFLDTNDINQVYRLSIEDRGDVKDPSFTHYLERFFGHLVKIKEMKLIGIS
jgi:lipopolysaccharide biosynthesis protein